MYPRSQTRALGGRPDQPAGAPGIPSGRGCRIFRGHRHHHRGPFCESRGLTHALTDTAPTDLTPSAAARLPAALYAVIKHKLDHHPNAQGHDLVGNLAAACVAKQLAVAARHNLEQPKLSLRPVVVAQRQRTRPSRRNPSANCVSTLPIRYHLSTAAVAAVAEATTAAAAKAAAALAT